MTLADLLEQVLGALKTVAPAYLRDTLKQDDQGDLIPPTNKEHLILDLTVVTPQGDFSGTVYNTTVVQVTTFAHTALVAITNQEAARQALESMPGVDWQLARVDPIEADGQWRGVAGTYRFEVSY